MNQIARDLSVFEFLQMNEVRGAHVIASGFQRTNGGKKNNFLPNYF